MSMAPPIAEDQPENGHSVRHSANPPDPGIDDREGSRTTRRIQPTHAAAWAVYAQSMRADTLEQALKRVPGVEAVRVILDGAQPTEVHVVAAPGKPAKQIVRDLQSMAIATLGTQIDRRVVSVVQVEPGDLENHRVKILDVSEAVEGPRMEVRVTLAWHDQRLIGAARGPAASSTRDTLAAEATLNALEELLDDGVAVAVTGTARTGIGSREVALVMVVVVAENRERTVVGSGLVSEDPIQATVRATLDAMNRQIHVLGVR